MLASCKEIYNKKMKIYALRLKDKKELKKSSSGGAFTAFSDYFLENRGAVVSAIYNYETNQNEFVLYTEKKYRDMARGSKYIQAYPLDSYEKAEQWVKNNNRELLFLGTGCQAEAFRKFSILKNFRDKVTIMGIICHGVSSPQMWKEYIGEGKIEYVTFKDKRNGWKNPYAYIVRNGKEIDISNYDTIYYNGCALRPSCYKCPFCTVERNVDITIGDFWGIEKTMPQFYSSEGNSLILLHTEKGIELFEKIKEKIEFKESNLEECIQPNLICPTERPLQRTKFWDDYSKGGMKKIIKKYVRKPLWKKCFYKIKNKVRRI